MKSECTQYRSKFFTLQIDKKIEDVQLKLHQMAKSLGAVYPIYDGMIAHRKLKNDGFLCALIPFMECPPNERFANRCKFSIGKCRYCWHNFSTTGWCVPLCNLHVSLRCFYSSKF